MIDYNTLETVFLITSTLILIGGMMFQSTTMQPGSPGYIALTAGLVIMICTSGFTFVALLAHEAVRAFRFGRLYAKAAQHTKSRAKFLKSPAHAHLNVRELERLSSNSSMGSDSQGSPEPTPTSDGRFVITSPVAVARALAARRDAGMSTAPKPLPSPPQLSSTPPLPDNPQLQAANAQHPPSPMVMIPLANIRRNPMLSYVDGGRERAMTSPNHIAAHYLSAGHSGGSGDCHHDCGSGSGSDDGAALGSHVPGARAAVASVNLAVERGLVGSRPSVQVRKVAHRRSRARSGKQRPLQRSATIT